MVTKPLFVLLFFIGLQVYSQKSVVAAYGNVTNQTGSVTFSIGQVVNNYESNPTHSINQGVQQPFEISVLNVNSPIASTINLLAYPNPTRDILTLEVNNFEGNNFQYHLISMNGAVLQNQKITSAMSLIQFKELPVGVYLLKITKENKEIKTFKIIKN